MLHTRNSRLFILGRFLAAMAGQMLFVSVGWQIYSITGKVLDLGLIGLSAFLPFMLLIPIGGQLADSLSRKKLILVTQSLVVVVLFLLSTMSLTLDFGTVGTFPIYAAIFLIGGIRAFGGPSWASILPTLVPLDQFSKAVGWNSGAWQLAMVVGPAFGGLLYGATHSPGLVYGIASLFVGFAIFCIASIDVAPQIRKPIGRSMNTLLAGIRYVKSKQILMACISLDLFVVLLGGCIALLPAVAKDVLLVGPEALGLLRAAPAVGAVGMAIFLAHYPAGKNAGKLFLAATFCFGASILSFGFSRNFALSLGIMAVSGAADMLSVTIRQTLVQLSTPDEMRGRVSAVSQIFIGASNELGEFESGVTASLFGLRPAILIGGAASCCVVILWSRLFPELTGYSIEQPPKSS